MNGPNQERDPRREGPARMLGGYATGNLSEQEKEALFAEALKDQHLFDALMEEEAFRELVEQPGVKRELIEALQPRESGFARLRKWWGTPMAWGAMGAAATALVLLVVVATRVPQPGARLEVAQQSPASAPQTGLPRPEAPPPERNEARANAPSTGLVKPKAAANRVQSIAASRTEEGEAKREAPAAIQERDERTMADAAAQQQQANPRQQALPQQAQEQQSLRQDGQQQVQSAGAAPRALGAAAPGAAAPAAMPPPAAASAVGRPVLEYSLLKRNEQGEYTAATSFGESDAVRIRVTAREEGFLTLVRRGETKPIVSAMAVRAGQSLQLPASGFLLPGTQPYQLLFSRQSAAPGASGVIGGFRQRTASLPADELSKSKDALTRPQVVFEILIRGTEN